MNLLKIYQFRMPKSILFGLGAAERVGERVKELGGKRSLIVSDKLLRSSGAIDQIEKHLKRAGVDALVYDEVITEPTTDQVNKGTSIFHSEKCDSVVALGGGSCIDAGKGIALLGTNPGEISEYEGRGKVKTTKSPMIAIPTTAGTGSELTWVSVIHDPKRDVKFLIYSPYLVPEEAIEDPLLTVSMPPNVTMSSGMDALTHAIEGYISTRDPHVGYGSPPLIDFLAIPAIELISKNLRIAWADGENIESRSNMLLGQLLAGLTFGNSGTALVHGMARPLGAHFHVPHGLANAVLLPYGLEFTYIAAPEKFAQIAQAMGEDIRGLSPLDGAAKTVVAVKRLCSDIRVPRLRDLGIDEKEYIRLIPQMAEDGIASGTPQVNPRKPTEKDLVDLFKQAY